MSVVTFEKTKEALLESNSLAWGYQVSLGLIGVIYTGHVLSPASLSTSVGKLSTGVLLFATAVAFTGAYLTAAELDERGER
ncbi:hypothetical protein PM015_06955 [Halorubrum ezzemoulense]|nr:hypothetical protein [Halorubrum ezzemoulense]MDB2244504.1 hypothetical protein [Halorubrum ezzemoulense]MDB2278739.1 hypothetical protein [Halorubrum ezzemoulense]MDB2285801.1 hypothetical protein [Halorubrum ezzemoulense]MDB2287838.1 hypothetical protein [Halorubrum ezzemoulense]MDB2291963.1 hypothetical protein [Halorubrum ezzemoulense]